MVPVVITDTSSRAEDQEFLHSACRQASVIVLCFRMDDDSSNREASPRSSTTSNTSLRRISSYWMPELKRLNVKVPVLLVGCKSDLRPADESLHKAVLPIVKAYPQIETCMECSAKKLQFVGEVFYYALKAVIYPMAPLYDPEMQSLKPLCVRALKRIFLMCDKDKDGLLNDKELNEFQVKCFNAPLQPEELAGVKDVVKSRLDNGLVDNHLTFSGFVFLHALFIERGRLETTWAVLTTFGYGKELDLSTVTKKSDSVSARSGLSHRANCYFAEIFDSFDSDHDGILSTRDQDQLFGSFPDAAFMSIIAPGMLFETESKPKKGLTKSGWLSFWNYVAVIDPRAVVEGALYSGLDATEQTVIDTFFDYGSGHSASRTVQGTLFCHNDSCRDSKAVSSLLANLVGLGPNDVAGHAGACGEVHIEGNPAEGGGASSSTEPAMMTTLTETTGTSLSTIDPTSTSTTSPSAPTTQSSKNYLALDFSVESLTAAYKQPAQAGHRRHSVGAFVFDWSTCTPEQFSHLMQAMIDVASASRDTLPCVLIGLSEKPNDEKLLRCVEEWCETLHIPQPITVAEEHSRRSVYVALVKAALEPERHIPETPSLIATKRHRRLVARASMYAGIGCVVAAGCFIAYRSYRSNISAARRSSS